MFEPNTIKTLLSMKRGKNNTDADSSTASTAEKSFDATTLTTNIGFATIQESLDLKNEMDQFLKDHEKWKAEYAENLKKLNATPQPAAIPKIRKTENESKEQLTKELTEMNKKFDNTMEEMASNKTKMQEIQRLKAEFDRKLELSQKALENKGEVEKWISPLDELQGQLGFEVEELPEVLKATETRQNEKSSAQDTKVAKILADLDEDMKELDELLK